MPVHESHPHGAPCWADLLTTDADGARAFYGGLFGWSFDIAGAEYNHYTTCEKGGKTVVGLSAMPPGMPPMPPAWNVYFASVDVDASCAAIGAAGGTVAMPPMTVGEMGRMAGALDPSGAYFGWRASAIGKNFANAKTFLEKRYDDKMELEDAIHTALLTLREGFEGEMTASNIEVAVVGADKVFRVLSAAEVADFLAEAA